MKKIHEQKAANEYTERIERERESKNLDWKDTKLSLTSSSTLKKKKYSSNLYGKLAKLQTKYAFKFFLDAGFLLEYKSIQKLTPLTVKCILETEKHS